MSNGPPSPEEFQKRFREMLRQQFKGAGMPFAEPASPEEDPPVANDAGEEFQFGYKPKDVKAYLDRFVIRQDDAKKVLSVALCDHYHHVRMAAGGGEEMHYAKQNVLLVGPTGVGKTYLIRSVADLIGVPFVKADASKFSETGYVGGDVEDLVRDLLRQADGDVSKAQYGIIYIDEIDKIAAAGQSSGRDVSGRGVQTNLLKLMEETDVPARAPNDIGSQIQAMMEAQRGGKKRGDTINTRHILFVVSGAFDGLEKITQKRLRESAIGFAAREGGVPLGEELMADAQTRDFIEYGFEPEFIGRLPVRVFCHSLGVKDLFSILRDSEGSIIRQYERSFAAYGIEVLFRDEGLQRIAELGAEERTGARGLMTVCEKVFRDLKFELPSTHVKRFVVDRTLVDAPGDQLAKLLAEQAREETDVVRQLVGSFFDRCGRDHGLKLSLTDRAVGRLAALAAERSQQVRDLCSERFRDLPFGLKLIAKNTGQTEFELDLDLVENPDSVLSSWVVASYREEDQDSEGGGEGSV